MMKNISTRKFRRQSKPAFWLALSTRLSAEKSYLIASFLVHQKIIYHISFSQHINTVMALLHFPHVWKFATVISIPNTGKPPQLPTSYRPISLSSSLSKETEKIILERLKDFFETKGLALDIQHSLQRDIAADTNCAEWLRISPKTLTADVTRLRFSAGVRSDLARWINRLTNSVVRVPSTE